MTRLFKILGTLVGSLVVVLLLCAAAGLQASNETKPGNNETLVYAGTYRIPVFLCITA